MATPPIPTVLNEVPTPPPLDAPFRPELKPWSYTGLMPFWWPRFRPWGLTTPTVPEIDLKLTQAQNKLNLIKKTWPVALVCAVVLVGIAAALYTFLRLERLPLVMVGAVVVAASTYIVYRTYAAAKAENEITTLQAQRKTAATAEKPVPPSVADDNLKFTEFDQLVQINVSNLASYYALVAHHAGRSFAVSLGGGALGFALIVAGLVFSYTDHTNAQTLSFIASGSGVLTEFIAAVFFYLYNRTVRQMKEYHDSLLTVQNVLLSMKIVSGIKEPEGREKMIGQMLGYVLAGIRTATYKASSEEIAGATHTS